MSSTGDAVDGAGISNTACGNEIEYMTDRKAFSKLLAAYEQGKLDWSTYTDPNIRGKHCTYAGAIAKDRESYVAIYIQSTFPLILMYCSMVDATLRRP